MNPLHCPEVTEYPLDEIALTAMGEELDDQVPMSEISVKAAKAGVGALASQARVVTASVALDLLRLARRWPRRSVMSWRMCGTWTLFCANRRGVSS